VQEFVVVFDLDDVTGGSDDVTGGSEDGRSGTLPRLSSVLFVRGRLWSHEV